MKRVEDIVTPQGRLKSEVRRKKSQKVQTKARTKKGPEVRVGKTGRIRLTGRALTELRQACFCRDKFLCRECGRMVAWDVADAERGFGIPVGEMAHIQSRGAGGSDILENVRTLCPKCHRDEHNAGGKPCPKKERACGVQGWGAGKSQIESEGVDT